MILVCRPAVQRALTTWQISGAAFLPTFTLEGLCTPRSGAEDHSTVISGPGTTAVGSLWEKSEKWGQAKLLPSSKWSFVHLNHGFLFLQSTGNK